MNVFVLDELAHNAARYHCDKHVVKMVLESAQLLSQVHHALDPGTTLAIYKAFRGGHANHPCAQWVAKTGGNYEWLYDLACALASEFTLRYGKTHATELVLKGPLRILPNHLRSSRLLRTQFPLCMPEKYRQTDPVLAYRTYYVAEKLRFARWTNRQTPSWVEELRNHADNLKGET